MKNVKILVPLDGSALAEAAVRRAIDYADGGADLVLLRAAEAWTLPGGDVQRAQLDAVTEAEEYLKIVAAYAFRRGARTVETHVWYGSPAPAIIEAASVLQVDLIVMSTHGRKGLGRLVFGSVAERVLRGTKTSILLVHGPEPPDADFVWAGRRWRHFWCAVKQRDVAVEFDEERGLGRWRQVAVRRCTAFKPLSAIACEQPCAEPAFRDQSRLASPVDDGGGS
jgi:nucleotide-binding universal stress UspA family protein